MPLVFLNKDHIKLSVCISRFNKIGSEGLASHTVEGESMGELMMIFGTV